MSVYVYRHRLTVRFRDCDAMGHVNHAVFFTYLEQCRLTCWRDITGAPSPLTRVIVAHAACDYRAPAHFGDELEIALGVDEIGRSSFTLVYEITRARANQVIATGRTVMVAYDYDASKSMPLPEATRALLERMASATAPFPRTSVYNPHMVTIFGKDTCPYTQAARDDYDRRGVPFEYVNVKKNPAELERMLGYSNGRRAVPVIVDGERVTIGFGGT